MKTLMRRIAQFMGFAYRDDGSWRLGYLRRPPSNPDSEN